MSCASCRAQSVRKRWKHERKNRRRQSTPCPELQTQWDKINFERNSPSVSGNGYRCVLWLSATVHIWTAELPHVPSRFSITLCVSSLQHGAARHPGKAIGWKTWPNCQFTSCGESAARRPEKSIISAAWKRDFGGGWKVWGISQRTLKLLLEVSCSHNSFLPYGSVREPALSFHEHTSPTIVAFLFHENAFIWVYLERRKGSFWL